MSIFVRECGHSDNTTSIHNLKNPDSCFYCGYLQKHPRKRLYEARSATEYRQAHSERMKKAWKAKKAISGA